MHPFLLNNLHKNRCRTREDMSNRTWKTILMCLLISFAFAQLRWNLSCKIMSFAWCNKFSWYSQSPFYIHILQIYGDCLKLWIKINKNTAWIKEHNEPNEENRLEYRWRRALGRERQGIGLTTYVKCNLHKMRYQVTGHDPSFLWLVHFIDANNESHIPTIWLVERWMRLSTRSKR
jgi:hypothetical protein